VKLAVEMLLWRKHGSSTRRTQVAIDSKFSLLDAGAAFARSLATGKQGKVVFRVVDEETAAKRGASEP
jgi:hypothetical protein